MPKKVTEKTEKSKEPEKKENLPFPTASVVRLMRANLDREKIIKKEVKIGMNKWLGKLCEKVSKEMNKAPYVAMNLHEFEKAKEVFDSLEKFDEEKKRILAHLDAMKKDIERLERDLGKVEEE